MNGFFEIFFQDYKKLAIGDMWEKYRFSLPPGLTIQMAVEYVFDKKLEEELLVDGENFADSPDKEEGLYLIKLGDGGYEVFNFERRGKHLQEKHSNLRYALTDYIDRLFNALGYSAPDTKIR